MGRDYVSVPVVDHILVAVYDSVIGKIGIISPEVPRHKQMSAGCHLRKFGFRHYLEPLYDEVSRQFDEWCEGRPAYVKAEEFDMYIKCEEPHPVFGCKVIGHTVAQAYLLSDGRIAIAADGIVIYSGAKNIFGRAPAGRPLEGLAMISWSIAKDEAGNYSRYVVDFFYYNEEAQKRVSGFAEVDSGGNVISMIYNEG